MDFADPGPYGVTGFGFGCFSLELGALAVRSLLFVGLLLPAEGGGGAGGAEALAEEAFRNGIAEDGQVVPDIRGAGDHPSFAGGEVQQFLVPRRLPGGLEGVLVTGGDDGLVQGVIRLCGGAFLPRANQGRQRRRRRRRLPVFTV